MHVSRSSKPAADVQPNDQFPANGHAIPSSNGLKLTPTATSGRLPNDGTSTTAAAATNAANANGTLYSKNYYNTYSTIQYSFLIIPGNGCWHSANTVQRCNARTTTAAADRSISATHSADKSASVQPTGPFSIATTAGHVALCWSTTNGTGQVYTPAAKISATTTDEPKK